MKGERRKTKDKKGSGKSSAGRLRVCVVTGTRAEFGIWRPVLRAIAASSSLELQLVVTGMHLLPEFGDTVKEIEAEKCPIAARVEMYRGGEPAAESLSRGIQGLAAAYRKLQPDVVLVLGDRLEMLAAASAALAERIAIGHVHGGETAPGIWDEQIRHAITKMAHVHFCATEKSRERILRMGEAAATVHLVGAGNRSGNGVLEEHRVGRDQIESGTEGKKRTHDALLVLHPSGGNDDEEFQRTKIVLAALKKTHVKFTALGPNNDPGHRGILDAYRAAGVAVEMSLSQDRFWRSLAFSSVLVGNSSSGIIEAASFGVPVVNVGARQAGRERSGNVIDVPWHAAGIEKAIWRTLTDHVFLRRLGRRRNIYGDGAASVRIASVLEGIAKQGVSLTKQFRDA